MEEPFWFHEANASLLARMAPPSGLADHTLGVLSEFFEPLKDVTPLPISTRPRNVEPCRQYLMSRTWL